MDTLQLPGFGTLSTQLAQALYDPANRLASAPELSDKHDEFAGFILNLYDLTPDASGVLLPALICDAVESGLDTEDVLIARAKKQEEVSELDLGELIVPNVKHLIESTQQQAGHILEQIGVGSIDRGKQTLYASTRIAQAAYDGKTRKTGEPYYQHPKRAAAMALHIFSQLEAEDYNIEPGFKDAVICATLLHDATEETIRSCKYYDPDRPKGFSPLLVREIFRLTGNPHGQIVANSLRLMTHHAKQAWAPDYETYVSLGSSDFIFGLVKPLDMGDNLLHPKPTAAMDGAAREKVRNKRELYQKLIGTMAINTAQRSDNSDNRLWTPRYFQIFRDITPDDMPRIIRDLNVYIYGNANEPSDNRDASLRPGSSATKLTFPTAA